MFVGVTDEWLEAQVRGSVDKVTVSSKDSSSSASSLAIEWSGLICGEGDELYHCVWENTEGVAELSLSSALPPSVRNSYTGAVVNTAVLERPFHVDGDTWLFQVTINSN
jgi:hypothetical protein